MADVILIHGAGDSAAVWEHQIEALGREHRVVALDLPGHGARLAETARADHAANAAEVARAVADQGMRAPVLVGHSMGGAVALTYALNAATGDAEGDWPLGALALVATGARLRMHPTLLDAARERAEAAPDAPLTEPVVPPERCLGPNPAPAVVAWLRAHGGRATARAVYADFLANNAFDVMDRLGAIRVPTLVIGGADDQMAPPKFVQYLADHITGARLILLPGTGHYPMAEQPGAFNGALAAILDALS